MHSINKQIFKNTINIPNPSRSTILHAMRRLQQVLRLTLVLETCLLGCHGPNRQIDE